MGQQRINIDLLIHDLKNPLTVVQAGLAGLLERQAQYGPLTPRQQRALERMKRNVLKARMLVNDALEIGRSGQGVFHRSEMTVSEIIRQVFLDVFDLSDTVISDGIRACAGLQELIQKLVQAGVYLDILEKIWNLPVQIDGIKTEMILRNLLNNALKYRQKEIRLSVGIFAEESGGIPGPGLLISVKDDGEGIPGKYHQKIFDCYFQLSPDDAAPVRGHGIGLAGVLALSQDLGGSLDLISDAGKGAEFIVRLPFEPDTLV